MKEWIKKHRILPVSELIGRLNQKLKGHYQYYGVTDNMRSLKRFLHIAKWVLFKWLNRRSQKRSYTSDAFNNGLLITLPIVEPTIRVSLFYK